MRIIRDRKFVYKINDLSLEEKKSSYLCSLPGLNPVSQNEKGQRNSVLKRITAIVYEHPSRKPADIIHCFVLFSLSGLFYGLFPTIFAIKKASAYPFVLAVRELRRGFGRSRRPAGSLLL